MTRNPFSVRSNPFHSKKIPFPDNYYGSILYENFLLKNLEDNQELKIISEIKKKKHEISQMFRNKFGKNFLNVKPDSLILFQKLFGQYLFDPDSQFLSHFPKLQRAIRQEKKISDFKLKDKIDMGALVFFDLRNKGKKQFRHLNMAKEKMLAISKNLETAPNKDVVETGIYQTKFWNKNKIKLANFFKKRFKENMNIASNNLIIQEKEDDLMENSESVSDIKSNEEEGEEGENSSINNSSVKDIQQKEIDNLKLSLGNPSKKNSKIEKISDNLIKVEPRISLNDKKINDENKDKKIILTARNNKNSISSYKFGNPIQKLFNPQIKSRNLKNLSGLFQTSNTFKHHSYNTSNSKINESNNNNSNFFNTANNFNSSNSKLITQSTTIFKKYLQSKMSKKKKLTSLKNNHFKFKNKLSNQITKLNEYTNKCNTELIKLIDINNDGSYKEKKRQYQNRNKIDIKEDLIERKQIEQMESSSENSKQENENEEKIDTIKEGEKDTIFHVLQGARKDMNDKFGGKLVPQNPETILKKNINHIPDERALQIVDDFIKKEKELDIREILGTSAKLKMKKIQRMKNLRLKTKQNYDKMVRLKNQIIIEKGKIFSDLEKTDINKVS